MFDKIESNNFWSGKVTKFGYIRELYLSRLENYLDNNLIKVLMGQRRSGKSYLLRMLIHNLMENRKIRPGNILYINMDLHDFDYIKDSHTLINTIKLYKEKLNPPGKVFLFIDEIQEIEGWEKAINSLSQDHKEQYEIFITGSNSRLLSSELSTYLSGRYVNFEIFPFGFDEFCGIRKLARDKKSFLKYLETGGIPEIYSLKDPELRQNYVMSLKDSIILRDIIQKNKIRDVNLLGKLTDFLIDSTGSLFSVNSVVKNLVNSGYKTNNETISNYLNFLKEAYFIHDSVRFDLKGKRILQGERKYYLNDLAFKYHLSSSYDFAPGRYLENIVFIELKRQGFTVFTGNINGREIDFIAEKDGERKYIQVTYLLADENVIQREFGNLEMINDNYEKLVISLDDINMGNRRGIKHIQAWEFCS